MVTHSAGTDESAKPLRGEILPELGTSEGAKGPLVPFEYIGPIIDARVGQMKAEVERDFATKLAKIDQLPTKWQLIAGAATSILAVIGLLFALLSYFGDRQDSAIDRSGALGGQLGRIENMLDAKTREPVVSEQQESE